MLTAPRNRAFTLVEIVAALGAFAIAFLSGFAAIGALMIRQDINYRSTVAASAAMLFVQKSVTEVNALTNATALMDEHIGGIPADTRFRGYPVAPEGTPLSAADLILDNKIFTFKTVSPLPGSLPLTEYRPIIMTRIRVGTTGPAGGRMVFWYGAPEEVEAGRATTLDYLGSYYYTP